LVLVHLRKGEEKEKEREKKPLCFAESASGLCGCGAFGFFGGFQIGFAGFAPRHETGPSEGFFFFGTLHRLSLANEERDSKRKKKKNNNNNNNNNKEELLSFPSKKKNQKKN
jgi:hypothetical protein